MNNKGIGTKTPMNRLFALFCSVLLGGVMAWIWLPALTYANTLVETFASQNWFVSKVEKGLNLTSQQGNTSIEVDSSGQVYLSYASDQGLRYATLQLTTWITQQVDSGARVGGHSLVIDSSGHPHIAYISLYPSATTGILRYATMNGTSWVTTTIDADSSISGRSSCAVTLVLDSNDKPHVVYGSLPNLRYATLSNTTWITQTVDNSIAGNMCSSIDIGGSGQVHIAYYDSGEEYGGILRYTVLQDSTWISTTVDEFPTIDGSEFGLPRALQLDTNGKPRILYSNAPAHGLKYAVLSGTQWISETVPFVSIREGEMVLDQSNNPHIVAGSVYVTHDLSGWTSQSFDSSVGSIVASSISLSDTTHIAISYLDTYSQYVKVAQNWNDVKQLFLPSIRK